MRYKSTTVLHLIWYIPWLPLLVVLPVLPILKRDEVFPPNEKQFVGRLRLLSVLITVASAVPVALGLLLHFSSHRISPSTFWILVVIFLYGVVGIVLAFFVKHKSGK